MSNDPNPSSPENRADPARTTSPQTFEQPRLDPQADTVQPKPDAEDAAELPTTELVDVDPNENNDDELSRAVVASRAAPVVDTPPEEVKPSGKGKYRLTYLLHGEKIEESYHAVANAVARVADLRRLGIVPATKTVAE